MSKTNSMSSVSNETSQPDSSPEQGMEATKSQVAQTHESENHSSKNKKQGDISRVTRMGSGSIPLLLAEFAVPAIAGMLVNAAYNLIDSVFLGQAMGEIGLATATVAMPITTIFMALSMLVGNGGNALAALLMGEGKHEDAERTLGNTVTLAIIMSIIVAALALTPLIEPLLSISGATSESWDYARTFIRILSMGFVFQTIGMGVNNFIRTAGAPNRALVTMVIGAVACTILNFLFVMVLGWGVAGSALATILGQACSCASVLWYFIFTPNVPIRLRGRYMALRMSLVKQILSLGVASFILQAGMAVVNFVLNNLLNIYGSQSVYGAEGALASIGIVQRVAMFVVMPLIGMSVAAQPLLGYCYGARNFARVRKAFFCAEVGAISLGVIGWIIIRLFAHPIVGFFGVTDPSLADFTASAMKIQLLVLPLAGFQIVGSNYFQATGQPVKSIFLTLTRQIIFLIPLYIVLPQVLPVMFPQYTGLDALYFSVPLSDTLSCIAVALFIIREMRKLRRKEAQQAA